MTIKKMKKWIAAVVLVLMAYGTPCSAESVDTLTYAVFPYLPDAVYYQELIEKRWAEIEPGIKLIRADWDCYEDAKVASSLSRRALSAGSSLSPASLMVFSVW